MLCCDFMIFLKLGVITYTLLFLTWVLSILLTGHLSYFWSLGILKNSLIVRDNF